MALALQALCRCRVGVEKTVVVPRGGAEKGSWGHSLHSQGGRSGPGLELEAIPVQPAPSSRLVWRPGGKDKQATVGRAGGPGLGRL